VAYEHVSRSLVAGFTAETERFLMVCVWVAEDVASRASACWLRRARIALVKWDFAYCIKGVTKSPAQNWTGLFQVHYSAGKSSAKLDWTFSGTLQCGKVQRKIGLDLFTRYSTESPVPHFTGPVAELYCIAEPRSSTVFDAGRRSRFVCF